MTDRTRAWDRDFYHTSPRWWWWRVASCRCVECDAWVVDAYFCYDCAFRAADIRQDDERAPTATEIGRARRLLVDQAAAYEQHIQLQSINDGGVLTVGDSDEAARSNRVRRLRRMNQATYLTPSEYAKASEMMGPATIGGSGKYASKALRLADRRRHQTATACVDR